MGSENDPAPFALPDGAIVTLLDPNGNPLTVKLDRFGGLIEATDVLGRTTTFERNADGHARMNTFGRGKFNTRSEA